MTSLSMHLVEEKVTFTVEWVRQHRFVSPARSVDYILLRIKTEHGEANVYLTGDQACQLAHVVDVTTYERESTLLSESYERQHALRESYPLAPTGETRGQP